MRISLHTGEAFDLPADFQIEITRLNPFFSELGEHSVPITFPPSPRNARLLGFAHDITVSSRDSYQVTIEDSGFFYPASMRLLSASRKDGYECTMLLNLGLLYSKLQSDKLTDIVKLQYEQVNLSNVDRAIGYLKDLCKRVSMSDNDAYDCFPVLADKLLLNEYAFKTPSPSRYFSAEVNRRLDVEGVNTLLPKGFLLTPFLRLRPLLLRLFAHYGYRINSWGVLDGAPYADMVLLNYNYDTIVNAKIIPTQLAPDCSCSELLSAIEGKFLARWVVDEASQSVSFVTLNQLLERPSRDLSPRAVSPLNITYPERYKYLSMKSQGYVKPVFPKSVDTADYERPENLTATLSDSTGLSLDPETGILYRFMLTKQVGSQLLAAANLLTDHTGRGKGLDEEAVSIPDTVPALQRPITPTAWADRAYIQIGQGRWLNSFARVGGKVKEEKDKTGTLPIMLGIPVSGFGSMRQGGLIDPRTNRSLLYNGKGGLYDLYGRKYDALLRNALAECELDVQLHQSEKMSLSAVQPITIANARFLPAEIEYTTRAQSIKSLKLRALRYKPQELSADEIEIDYNALSRHSWQLGYILKYTDETPGYQGFYADPFFDSADGFKPISTTLFAAGAGAGTIGGGETADLYHWIKLSELIIPDWESRGDRTQHSPTSADLSHSSEVLYIYTRSYDTGSSPMPQPQPGDPPFVLRAKYLTIQICLRPVALPIS